MLALPPLPRNLDASFRDLSSVRPAVRADAIASLSRHAGSDGVVRERALPLLRARLLDEHASVRAASAIALSDLAANEAVPDLLQAVSDDDAYVRQMALSALGELGDARALPRLRLALTDARPEMRYQAIIAFARTADDPEEVTQRLLDATNDIDDAVVHIGLRVAEERIDTGHEVDTRLVARAKALLGSTSPHVALVAAIVLGKSGEPDGNALLLRVVRGDKLAGEPAEKEDERAAVELAGELNLEAARAHLERRAWGVMHFVRDTCAFHAKIALARMGHPRATFEILQDLASRRPDVLAAAVVAAGRARLLPAREVIERMAPMAADPELVREALRLIAGDAP